MNRQQRKNFIKGMHIKERLSIAVTMPPKERPIVREYSVGRNDPCPCGKTIQVEHGNYEVIINGYRKEFKEPTTSVPVKYKNCCMKSGKYENYKTNE